MIERKVSDKPVFFELSIGNAGNCLDGSSTNKPSSEEDDSEDESGEAHFMICTPLSLSLITRPFYFIL